MALDKVIVLKRRLLQLLGNIQQGVDDAQGGQHLIAGLLDDPRPRIVMLVDPVAETHQPERVGRILGLLYVLAIIAAFSLN